MIHQTWGRSRNITTDITSVVFLDNKIVISRPIHLLNSTSQHLPTFAFWHLTHRPASVTSSFLVSLNTVFYCLDHHWKNVPQMTQI